MCFSDDSELNLCEQAEAFNLFTETGVMATDRGSLIHARVIHEHNEIDLYEETISEETQIIDNTISDKNIIENTKTNNSDVFKRHTAIIDRYFNKGNVKCQ